MIIYRLFFAFAVEIYREVFYPQTATMQYLHSSSCDLIAEPSKNDLCLKKSLVVFKEFQ